MLNDIVLVGCRSVPNVTHHTLKVIIHGNCASWCSFKHRMLTHDLHLYIYTVKPVYNDHLMGYFSAFWTSSRWPRATKLLARVNWYLQSSLKYITEQISGNKFYYKGGRYRQVSPCQIISHTNGHRHKERPVLLQCQQYTRRSQCHFVCALPFFPNQKIISHVTRAGHRNLWAWGQMAYLNVRHGNGKSQ